MLDDLYLPSRCNQHWQYSGIDSPEHCRDKTHFAQYPFAVDYRYNNRGFRDQEWPNSVEELQQAIWCVGDSFTVGLGQPFEHIWPQMLQQVLRQRTINVSMDGASNSWIARRARQILTEVQPRVMIIMWSYACRTESSDHTAHDEARRLAISGNKNYHDVISLCQHIDFFACYPKCKIVQCVVPGGLLDVNVQILTRIWNNIRDPSWPLIPPVDHREYGALPQSIINELANFFKIDQDIRDLITCLEFYQKFSKTAFLGEIQRLDIARDGHHFDHITTQALVSRVSQLL